MKSLLSAVQLVLVSITGTAMASVADVSGAIRPEATDLAGRLTSRADIEALATGAMVLRLDPAATRIAFTLGSTFHDVRGSLNLIEGEIEFDPETGDASGRVVIDALSAFTDNRSRDKKMHGKILETHLYPQIVFVPARFHGDLTTEDSEIRVTGQLEIHGNSHEIALAAVVRRDGDQVIGTALFSVPYVSWGIKDPSVFFLRAAKVVDIEIDLVGTLSGGKTGSPAP